jgi:glycosyltransferase involved in cell wall biosynthesis
MKIAVIGTRGYPHIQGGVEKHCEILYHLLAKAGHHIIVFRRKPYLGRESTEANFINTRFIDLWCPTRQSLEAITHSFTSAFICLFIRPDIVHIHNIGPSLILPLLKIGGLRVVVTYHSPNYEHRKWSWFAKSMLRLGEYFTRRFADMVIFVSQGMFLELQCKNKIHIPNGVPLPIKTECCDFLQHMKITPKQYILGVGRLSPEKGLHDLILAFQKIEGNYQLVIAGEADHETEYSRALKQAAVEDERVVLTGYITGEPLRQIFSHAKFFVLPSYHEGLPIALLEAMSYDLPVLVSDIPANKEVSLPSERFFPCGNVLDMKEKIELLIEQELSEEEKDNNFKMMRSKYDWKKIAEQTDTVYRGVLRP